MICLMPQCFLIRRVIKNKLYNITPSVFCQNYGVFFVIETLMWVLSARCSCDIRQSHRMVEIVMSSCMIRLQILNISLLIHVPFNYITPKILLFYNRKNLPTLLYRAGRFFVTSYSSILKLYTIIK